jgi:hypothetical protein
MKPVVSTICLFFAVAASFAAHAEFKVATEQDDDTLKFYLSKSDCVVLATITDVTCVTTDPERPNYLCTIRVAEVYKGDPQMAGVTTNVNIRRENGSNRRLVVRNWARGGSRVSADRKGRQGIGKPDQAKHTMYRGWPHPRNPRYSGFRGVFRVCCLRLQRLGASVGVGHRDANGAEHQLPVLSRKRPFSPSPLLFGKNA